MIDLLSMRLRNAILVAVVALLVACGGEDDGASSSGRFGEACYEAADCTGLKAQLNDSIKADGTIECAAAAGEPKCRFSCRTEDGKNVNPGAVEACAALGGECVPSGICLP